MKKEELIKELDVLTENVRHAKERLDLLEKENEMLRKLVHHLASRPGPYVQTPTWPEPPYKVTC